MNVDTFQFPYFFAGITYPEATGAAATTAGAAYGAA